MPHTIVYIKTQFIGFHRWKDAPEDVAYLRDWHRHVFHVRAGIDVSHPDREVEFHQLKNKVDDYLQTVYEGQRFDASCEMIAADLVSKFGLTYASVNEDEENGATYYA